MRILVLNPGSSTLKTSVLDAGGDRRAAVDLPWGPRQSSADVVVARALASLPLDGVVAVGYRVVHGGADHVEPEAVTAGLIDAIEGLDPLAPLHNRRAAMVLRAGVAALPRHRHVACFDTAFHASLPDESRRYAMPAAWTERWGIRRFGFHGLSVAWSVGRAAALLGRPASELALVIAHLGSGCSVTAVLDGRSMATSMGMTPLEGLVMGTRSGSIDPGVLIHLLRAGVGVDELATGLIEHSGLSALSGGEPNVEVLERRAHAGDEAAIRALAVFARSAASGIAAASTALPRLDALVFTGGIGENSTSVRTAIVARLATLGVPGDPGEEPPDAVLALGPPALLVVRAREDRVIADAVAAALATGA